MLLKILILPLTKSQTLSDQGQTDILTKKISGKHYYIWPVQIFLLKNASYRISEELN